MPTGKNVKILIGASVAIVAVALAGLLVSARPQAVERPITTAQTAVAASALSQAVAAPTAAEAPFQAEAIPPLPPDAKSVPDHDLLALSAAVDLPHAVAHRPDKSNWKEALVVANRLMEGPCDCEQRNWLNHFVEMGNFALTDAGPEYRESARLMSTLGRNDQQAMALSQQQAR